MAGLQTGAAERDGLTTTRAPFIEQAQEQGQLYIHQPYELYSEANHDAWRRLYARMESRWRSYANPRFLQGIDNLCLDPERVPRLEDVNRFLSPLTGFKAKAVSGYVPAFLFFDCLRNREFPTTITIRDGDDARLSPRAGHLPRHRRPRADAHRPRLCRHPGALRRLRAHRGRHRGRHHRRDGADPARHQHLQGDGAVLLVHDRVRADAERGRAQGLRQRAAQLLRRDRARRSSRPRCSAIRFSSSG